MEIALPRELNREQRQELAEAFGQALANHYGVAADVCCHNPNKTNPHAHILLSACSVAPDGSLGKKAEELDPVHCGKRRQQNPAELFRPIWEQMCNQALKDAGHDVRIDHRTLEAQGIEKDPGVHLGPKVLAFEKREGQESERRQKIRERQEEARVYKIEEERKTRADAEQRQHAQRRQLLQMLRQDAQSDLYAAREVLARVDAEKRNLERLREEKIRLEVENKKLSKLKNEIVVPEREAVLHGLRYQAKAKIDQDEKAKGRKPPFEDTDLRKLSLTDRIRKMRDQGRPAGLIAWMTGAGKHYDHQFAKVEKQLGLVLMNESKLNQWFSQKHDPRLQSQASATVATAVARVADVDTKIQQNTTRVAQLDQQIPRATMAVQQAEAKATSTMQQAEAKMAVVETKGQELLREADKAVHEAGGDDIGAMFKAMALRAEAAAEQQVADLQKQEAKRSAAASRAAAAVANGPK